MWKKINFFRSGENEIIDLLVKHTKISLHSMDNLIRIVSSDTGLEEYLNKIEKYEKNGDKICYKATRKVMEGAVSIAIINNLIKIIDDTDLLLDKILYLARESIRLKNSLNYRDKIMWVPIYENILHSNLIIRELNTMLDEIRMDYDTTAILKKRDRIEELEEEGDEMKARALDILYEKADDMDDKTFILLRDFILTIDDLEDLCEDIANHIILVKYILES